MVDEGVAVVLPVSVDFVVASNFLYVDWVTCVPRSHVVFHPWCHIPLVVANTLAALPSLPVSHREIEVGTSEITFEIIGDFKAFASRFIALTSTNQGAVGACVCYRARLNISKGQISSESINITIGWPKFE